MRGLSGKTWKIYICRLLICIMVTASFESALASETSNVSEAVSAENNGNTPGAASEESGSGQQPAADAADGQAAEGTTGGQGAEDDDETDVSYDLDDDDDGNSGAGVTNEDLLDDPDVDYTPTVSPAVLSRLKEYRAAASDPKIRKLAARTKKPKGKLTKKNGHIVYLCKSGKLLKNKWVKIKKAIYYFDSKGYAKTGAFKYKGYQYYADRNGKVQAGYLRKVGKKLYYYGPTGAMIKSAWITIKGNRYYFLASGAMAKKQWIGNSYVNSSGQLSRGVGSEKVSTGWFKSASKKQRLIIIGYSRAVHMSEAVTTDSNVIYIAKAGGHFAWVQKTAVPQLKKYLKKYPNSKVVFMNGYNDICSAGASSAIKKFRKIFSPLVKKYKKASFYFVDILPNESRGGKIGKRTAAFNSALKAAFPRQYIGGYAYLVEKGYENSFDHVHYAANTSRTIFNYILKKVK